MKKCRTYLLIIYLYVLSRKKRDVKLTNRTNTQKSWNAATEAFTSMKKHCIDPSANNYAVWLAYHSESVAAIKVDIDSFLSQGKSVDDYFCASLYENHIEKNALSEKLIDAGGSFESEMQDVLQDIEAARLDTKVFGARLEKARSRLVDVGDNPIVNEVVGELSSATDDMLVKSTALQARITQSRQEIASLKQELEQARNEASKDAMTGVANRKTFNTFLADSIEMVKKTRKPMSLIMSDIDFFKKINDRWGHQTGDQVICYLAGVLQQFAPKDGLVARLGGEEFAIIAPNTDARAAKNIAEAIRTQVERKKLIRRNSKEDLGQITVSLGIGQYENNEGEKDLIERADQALYKSKHNGRNRTTIADKAMEKAA